jgi:hypothetical protein
MNETIKTLKETLEGSFLQPNINANIGSTERILSVVTGAYFTFSGLKNVFSHPLIAIGEITLGGSLLKRGVTGYCNVTAKMDEQKYTDISIVGVVNNSGNL